MSREVHLDEELDRSVDELVRSGRFRSRDDVLRAGVALLREREALRRELDDALDHGVADVEAGRVSPAAEVFERLERRLAGRTGP